MPYNRRAQHREAVDALSKVKRLIDLNKFTEHEECVICLEVFKDLDEVTPLPCDIRHYFHSRCIEEWCLSNNTCPLCKKIFTRDLLLAQSLQSVPSSSVAMLQNKETEFSVTSQQRLLQ